MSTNPDETRNYYTSSYRRDVAAWGGQTYNVPENESATIDIERVAAKERSLERQLQKMEESGMTGIPKSTTQATYIAHMPQSRDVQPQFNGLVPPPMPIPDKPDESIFRMTTEYGSRFHGEPAQPMLNNDTLSKCEQTRSVKTRSVDQARPPMWETTYRGNYCDKVTDLKTSEAITTHKLTGLR